jgi:regulatory protein
LAFAKKKITEPLTPDEAVVLLERFCAYQERYTKEIRIKMAEYLLDTADAEVILDYLIEERYIDDARYADAYVRGKVRNNHWGFTKIRLSLGAKGIQSRYIDAAINQIPTNEYEAIAKKVAEKRQADVESETPFVQRQKISQTLLRAGYEQDLVVRVVDGLFGGPK